MKRRGIDERLAALREAADLADGRLDPDAVARGRAVVERAGQRLGLGVEITVVALAGPTGAGKSSVFNALAGSEVSRAAALRPTTSVATAAVWGDGAGPLLDWLEVPRRHHVDGHDPEGLVVLDLPDFDSVEAAHREEFERVLALTDLVVWIVDPEKYADAALHDRYLRPLAGHRATMVMALNQADRLSSEALDACRRDLGRLLQTDGLERVPVLAVSARTGAGVDELRRAIARKASERTAAVERLAADVTAAARGLDAGCGEGRAGKVDRTDRARLIAALGEAAGVPTVTRAVYAAHRRRGALAAGWPPVRWVRRLRPDPLRRLRLDVGAADAPPTSLPPATPVQRAQVSTASRALAASAAGDLPPPWPGLVRAAALKHEDRVGDRLEEAVEGGRDGGAMRDHLDRAVGSADLRMREPRWWRVAGFLQRLLLAVAAVGALWLVALVVLGYLQLDDAVPTPDVAGFPVPTLLLAGGLLAGALLAFAARLINGAGARRRAQRVRRTLDARMEQVAAELVLAPVEAELEARDRLCRALKAAA